LGIIAVGLGDRIPLGRGLIVLERRLDGALVSRAVGLDGTVDVAVPHPCTAVTFKKKLSGNIGDVADIRAGGSSDPRSAPEQSGGFVNRIGST
jgi:hypothetical protein